ncbi:MAG TPA: hypothetical protein VG452_08830 [Egibacteraceae bacterium]|nr:hypothetical protein [Egibacteraceae bacterium]
MSLSSCTPTPLVRTVTLVAVLVALMSACRSDVSDEAGGDTVVGGGEVTAELPPWLERIYPAEDQVVTVTRDVQVDHNLVEPDQGIRLLIDGVDVTTYSLEGRGELVYDPDRPIPPADPPVGAREDPAEQAASEAPIAGGPVDLSPGSHSATVQRVRVDPETGFIEETLDEFTWDFVIQ